MRAINRISTKKTIQTRYRVRKYRLKQKIMKQRENLIKTQLCSHENSNISKTTQPEKKESSSLQTKLRLWAIDHRVTAGAINDLLKILISCGLIWLPADYRSLLQTPRNIQITQVANGKFWYNGITNNLKSVFSSLNRDVSISLKFNVDGIPLFNSSKIQLWPILASIYGTFSIIHILQFGMI